ncbi:unnamed protein product [Caenorhabditis sp. 36 PRJEB53466]|nr:unnamed protein product [Caenorhabditis sp. 36 PRJEB53466]
MPDTVSSSSRPTSRSGRRRTTSRVTGDEPSTSTAPLEDEDVDEEEPIPMETDEGGPIDAANARAYIAAILLAENREVRDKLHTGIAQINLTDDGGPETRTQPVVEQIQRVEQAVLNETLEEVLKDPKYAVLADLTKAVETPEDVGRAMHPIEVKIEEGETAGAAPSASVLPSASGGETNVERAAKREAHVLARIAELRRNGLWSNSRLPKCMEPERNKTHWDYLLEEVKWMATDFRAETNTKRRIAKAIAHAIAKQHRDREIVVERAAEREIKEKKRMCASIAKMIRDFWQGVDKMVDIRAKEILESRLRKARNKHLMFMIGQVDEMSNIVQERLVPSKTPSIASDDINDKEFEVGESESDDEQTIANAEKSQRKDDVRIEVDALQNEATVEMDDFLSTLPPEYLEAYGLTQEDLEEMKRENQREREEKGKREEKVADDPAPGPSTAPVPEEEKSQDTAAEDGNGDGRGVLQNVDYLKLNSHDSDERQQELANIAEEALKFQPKGYTLETTQVKTPVPFLIRGQLREYQMVGLDWMVTLYEKNLNGILADEMGLGKTIQTISLLAHLACSESIWGPHLIVVPTSVILNWEMEFKKWCPSLKILTYFGTAKERAEKRKGWMKPNCFHVCITSYKTVTQDIRAFKQRAWQYLILDEAQNIKNWKSQRWQALLNVRARRRLLLTGTPLQNSLMELWSLMHFLMPTIFSSHDDFKDWFSNPLTGMMEGNMEFNAPLIQRLHKVLRPFILRRLKKEVEKQLPEKTEHIINCSLSKRQRYLYDDFMSRRSTKENLKSGNMMSVLNIVMQLRKCCNHPNLFEPRPVVAPFVVQKMQVDVPAFLFGIAEQKSEEEPVPEMLKLRIGWQTQVSSTRPLIEEMEAMETALELRPPVVDGFRFNRTAYVTKNARDAIETMASEEEVHRANGTASGSSGSSSSPLSQTLNRTASLIRSRTVMNTAPLTITTDRSGFHYTLASNGRSQLDERAPYSPPLKRAKLTGAPPNWTDYVPRDVVERMEESKRQQLEVVRRRFGQIRAPTIARELLTLLREEIVGEFPSLCVENDEKVQKRLAEYVDLLAERFGMYVEPVLTDAWQCRPSSSGLPSYIRHNFQKIERDSRAYLLGSSSDTDTRMSICRSLQFPELRLIEYDCGKLQTLAVLLRQLYLYKHRCLIFTQMSKMLDVLQTFLSHHGYQYFRLDGTTGVEQRQAMMERFNADPKVFCFILSTRSGGVGINLTGADTVIFYDSDWNPTMDAQAQDRCHRIGQTRNVSIYRLISERTIEENILKKATQKRRLGELAIDEAGFTPEFFKQTDNIRDLFDGENVDVEAPKDVPLNEKELEKAMAKCEDEVDVNAAKVAAAEARVDVAEFDENAKAPTSNLAGGDEETDEKYMELIQQLKPIERFAINLLEAEYKPEFEEECKEAEAMIEQKREEWDKNLNETAAHDADDLLNEDLLGGGGDFYQGGSLLDEVRDRRKQKTTGAHAAKKKAKVKPKKATSSAQGTSSSSVTARGRSPSKRKSTAPSFNPYISIAPHVLSSPPDSPPKKISRRCVAGGGTVAGGVGGSGKVRSARKSVKRTVMIKEKTTKEEEGEDDADAEEEEEEYKEPVMPSRKKVTVVRKVIARPITPMGTPSTTLPKQGPLISPPRPPVSIPSGPSTSGPAPRPIRTVLNRPPTLMPVKVIKMGTGQTGAHGLTSATHFVRRPVGAGGVASTVGGPTRFPIVRLPSSSSQGPSTSTSSTSASSSSQPQHPRFVVPMRARPAPSTSGTPGKMMFPVRVVQRVPVQSAGANPSGSSADRPTFGIYERPRLSLRQRGESELGSSRFPAPAPSPSSAQPAPPKPVLSAQPPPP